MLTSTAPRSRHRRPRTTPHFGAESDRPVWFDSAPIVVAVDNSSATEAAVMSGVRLATELGAALVFVYVRRGPWSGLGAPYYRRRLDAELSAGRSRPPHPVALWVSAAMRIGADTHRRGGVPRARLMA